MEGTYPIIIRGEKCGELSVTKEGAYTRFFAQCDKCAEVTVQGNSIASGEIELNQV